MSDPKSAQHEYRPDIDGLRAVAVLIVVAYHAFPEHVPGGFVGVDIFFVISGFLISGIIFKNLGQGTFSYAEFYRRRIRRIFPALIIVLVACLVLGAGAMLPDEYRRLGTHTATGAAFSANIQLWREAGYFDASSDHKPLLHLWSLGIEEQFYVIWPTCLVVLWRRKGGLVSAVFFLAALSFAINMWRVDGHATSTFYLPLTRFWELLLGCLLAHKAAIQGAPIVPIGLRRRLDDALAVIGLVLILVAVVFVNGSRSFPGWRALLPTVGAILLIGSGPGTWVSRAVLQNRAMVWIGLISYPLYLWHWPLLSFARIVSTPTAAVRLALVGVSVLLAWATWKLVEVELRARASRLGPRADIVALSVGLSVVCLMGIGVLLANGLPAPTHAQRQSPGDRRRRYRRSARSFRRSSGSAEPEPSSAIEAGACRCGGHRRQPRRESLRWSGRGRSRKNVARARQQLVPSHVGHHGRE